jgi:HEAT repeat protein
VGADRATDPDPATVAAMKRREVVIVAGHRRDEPPARSGLRDPDPAVRAAALSALARMERATTADVVACLADPSPAVRRRAARAASETAGAGASAAVGDALRDALGDGDALVVDGACWALGERVEAGATAALCAVAADHADPRCREAAVAALGAIGDPGGLDAVRRALADKPAVRRRAAVALSAFGTAGAEALRGCLDDRDWQVRQVAETLLGG